MTISLPDKVLKIVGVGFITIIVILGVVGIFLNRKQQENKQVKLETSNTSSTSPVNCSLYMDFIPNNPSPCASDSNTNQSSQMPTSTSANTAPTSQAQSTPLTVTPTQPATSQASTNADICNAQSSGKLASLTSSDDSFSQAAVSWDNTKLQDYNNGLESSDTALGYVNQNNEQVNYDYTTDYDFYMDFINAYGCAPAVSSALSIPQCIDITQCASEVPSR